MTKNEFRIDLPITATSWSEFLTLFQDLEQIPKHKELSEIHMRISDTDTTGLLISFSYEDIQEKIYKKIKKAFPKDKVKMV